ncbi:hypothetical protein [Flavobacterium suaedae]|nr:hypothetical protein [Flavobacterium suaedae]
MDNIITISLFLTKYTITYPNFIIANLKQLIIMQNRIIKLGLLSMLLPLFAGCELAGDIFEAGISVGIFIVIAIIALVLWLVYKVRK